MAAKKPPRSQNLADGSAVKKFPVVDGRVKKSPVKKSSVEISPAKISPVKISPVKKSPVKTSPAKRSPVKKSHFFAPPLLKTPPLVLKPKRPPAGTVSGIPFPPLDAPCFSLIQEELAHEPFWLLIAVTFLIKTAGKVAIPAFHAVRERFPTPADLADPQSKPILMDMIRHLGLCVNRTTSIRRYAEGWVVNPPQVGVTFRVRGYDQREVQPDLLGIDELDEPPVQDTSSTSAKGEIYDAWEIGHLTKGKYALDSWRIFCRDELLGRAEDWDGKGAAPEFQPEWMRVMPGDKELRACLRWMWMKEGWEWDPETGDKVPLRPEMEAAVNERRVEYDDTGGLRILDERPLDGAKAAV